MAGDMKIAIDIVDALVARAKHIAASEGVTLRDLVEDGLRQVLAQRGYRAPFRLRRATFRGNGPQPNIAPESWGRLRELAYGDHEA